MRARQSPRPLAAGLLVTVLLATSLLAIAPSANAEFRSEWSILFDHRANDVAVDEAGYVYLAGEDDNRRPFVKKMGAYGYVVWETRIGTSSFTDPRAIAIDGAANVYVVGDTFDEDMPTTPGAFQPNYGDEHDGWAAKLDSDGNIVYLTYLGGSEVDYANAVEPAADGSAVVVGHTYSCDYPVTPDAIQTERGGQCDPYDFSQDAFVTKLSPDGTTAAWSTYLGGSEGDQAHAVDVSRGSGSIAVGGNTGSEDFPVTPGAFQTTGSGGFVAKLPADGSSITWATYLGGSDGDKILGVDRDPWGDIVVAGETHSDDFPVTPGAFQTMPGGNKMCSYAASGPSGPYWVERDCPDAFIAKLRHDGEELAYSTYIATDRIEKAVDVAVDRHGFAYVTGQTNATNFPQIDTQVHDGGYLDTFAVALPPDGSTLTYATKLGGSDRELPKGVAVLDAGNAVHVGWTRSEDFPVDGAGAPFDSYVEGYYVRLDAPTEGLVFAHRGGNQWWVETYIGGRDGGDVTKVEARDDDSGWHTLKKRAWGPWAGSFHIDPAHEVRFRATLSDGTVVTSCYFSHPDGTERCPESFDPAFRDPSGNEWWVQVYVDAEQPLSEVHARVDAGAWRTLEHRDWGAWAASFHAPEGSIVQFQATAQDGSTALSSCYRWTEAAPTECEVSDGSDAGFRFEHRGGNEWWVEADVEPHPDEVQARDTGGEWRTLTYRDWGEWAGSFHIEPGHDVQFRARMSGGEWEQSCWYSHPGGTRQSCVEEGAFAASFHDVRGNEWWIETEVDASGGTLASVDARVDGGDWKRLEKTDWGSWARAMHAPAGSVVEFRAHSTDGDAVLSQEYDWPPS